MPKDQMTLFNNKDAEHTTMAKELYICLFSPKEAVAYLYAEKNILAKSGQITAFYHNLRVAGVTRLDKVALLHEWRKGESSEANDEVSSDTNNETNNETHINIKLPTLAQTL